MKKFFQACIATMFLCSGMVYAGSNNGPNYGDVITNNTNTTYEVKQNTNIDNDVRANASAYVNSITSSQSNSVSLSQGGSAQSFSNSGGNTQSVVVTDSGRMHYSGSYTVKNAPNVVSGNVYPTSPCMGGTSVGGSGVGFGFSVGSSWTDDECGIRETARSFAGMGMHDDAIAILCSSKYAAIAPACKKE